MTYTSRTYFLGSNRDHSIEQRINASPLLGRTDKLKLYHSLLNKYLKPKADPEYRMFLLVGEARQGKSRLIDELVYITPEEVPVIKLIMRKEHHKIPYHTIRLIFHPPLFFVKHTTVSGRTRRILDVLHNVKVPDFLCVLNDVFAVDFPKSASYLSFNEKERKKALRKMLKLLARAVSKLRFSYV